MARRPRVFAPGLLYHVIVRGNQRRQTFRHDQDYRAYLERLEKYRAKFQVRIYAYCLMPNHVHLLLETGSAPLAKFMQGLQQSYTHYFNRIDMADPTDLPLADEAIRSARSDDRVAFAIGAVISGT
jgi:putative transposase